VTEYETNAAAIMLMAFVGAMSASSLRLYRRLTWLTSAKKIKKSSQPSLFTSVLARANIFKKTVAIAMPVKIHPMTFISVPRLSVKSTLGEPVAMAARSEDWDSTERTSQEEPWAYTINEKPDWTV
jgi:hypothetical protein